MLIFLRLVGNLSDPIVLPEKYDNGTFAVLGDNSSLGFPTVSNFLQLFVGDHPDAICNCHALRNV